MKLLISSPNSIGNLGQLTADLLLTCFPFKFNRYLYSENLVPVVGKNFMDEEERDNLSAPIEIYRWEDVELVQIRSLPIDSRVFAEEMLEFVEKGGYSEVIVLCGLSMVEMLSRGVYDSAKKAPEGKFDEVCPNWKNRRSWLAVD